MENERMIEITVEEYAQLLKRAAQVEAFKEFVLGDDYYVNQRACAAYFGFELPKKD